MRKGFTLVELSIVLVIIGLLIGGLLVAQSMISTAKIQKFVREIQQFDVAIQNFKSKYNQIPGDSTLFAAQGNNDSYIFNNISANQCRYFDNEVASFWADISLGGFSGNGVTYTATVPAAGFDITSATRNAPAMAVGKKTSILGTGASFSGVSYNFYNIADYSAVTAANYNTVSAAGLQKPSIKPADALAIDKKLDDGITNSGLVQAVTIYADFGYFTGTGTTGGNCVKSAALAQYNTSLDTEACILSINILGQL